MSEARDTIEAGLRAWNAGDMEGFLASYADDATLWVAGMPAEAKGKDQIRQVAQAYFTAFPGSQFTTKTLIESGNWVTLEHVFTGTHNGVFVTPAGELPPTGKTVVNPAVDVFQLSGGRIIAQRTYFDNVDILTQLGVMPAASTAST
jgi:steroid delta-isomerase-like uncharacterized protein